MMQMLLMLHHWKHSRLHSGAAAVISFLLSCLTWLVTCCNPGILPSGLCCNGCVGEIPAPRAHHTLVLQRKLQECCSSCRATSAIEYQRTRDCLVIMDAEMKDDILVACLKIWAVVCHQLCVADTVMHLLQLRSSKSSGFILLPFPLFNK